MYYVSSMVKLLVIAAMAFAVSRLPGPGIVFLIQGLSMVYLGIVSSGLRQAKRANRHGT